MDTKDFSPFQLHGISFGTYTADEIVGLSVKELTNPQSFDSLQHPTSGGLYDPALGPQDRDDQCETCGQMSQWCPGHMGHISLPLPVYNPVFFKNLFQILKGTCFSCSKLLARSAKCILITYQLNALEHGLLNIVGEMQDLYSNVLNEQGTEIGIEDAVQRELEQCYNTALSQPVENSNTYEVKHVTEMRQQLIKEFLRNHLIPKGKKCTHCKMPVKPMRSEHNTKIFFQKGLDRKSAREMIEKKNRQKQQRIQALQEGNSDFLEAEEVEMETEVIEPSEDINEKEVDAVSAQLYLTPMDARAHMRKVWSNNKDVLMKLFGALIMKNSHIYPTDIFFLDVIPVAPNRFRPMAVMKERKYEHAQTGNLNKVLADAIAIRQILTDIQNAEKEGFEKSLTERETSLFDNIPGKTSTEKLQNVWVRMQTHVNCVVDSDLDRLSTDKHPGIKQLLEKKEGLFRKHMMGKRVNYAARSVISPDPYINTDEIGIPMVFALKLTYPQPVTPWNVQELRQAVINGPRQHPGAVFVENEDGSRIMLNPTDVRQREAIAKELLTPSTTYHGPPESKKVLRHLKNGDVLLLNRQPTLHRPSIQAHKARVLPGEKTLRLHYANCKAYNADFDGDEMNAHFVQDEIARAEAYTIASTNFQYLVPKDGTPLAGLIQDHMVSGVMLTLRGRFFGRGDYQQLVYAALTDKYGPVKLLRPGMIKPQTLWSGKQVLSTVLLNLIPEGKPALNLHGKTKIAGKNWVAGQPRVWLAGGLSLEGDSMSESEVVIRSGELLCGVLDKGHYGPTPYGLVHCCYELYGGVVACRLLTSLAKLFTTFLQQHGFTLGPEDILVTEGADKKRKKNVYASRACGAEAAAKALGVDDPEDTKTLLQKLEKAHHNKDGRHMMELDLAMKQKTDEYQNNIAKVCIPHGLQKIFPNNNLQLMVQSGAKGSSVNCMQISCLLGQIELEGRRPPLMQSGRSLPSFLPYDTSPRAGGFVDGRFLTGIRPQEYFFHCMAGREGLIDTAVKTSRSGYLQRCIIKHLEGIVVNYDMSVRDSDGSVVQFQYGEDGLDILKTPFLNKKQFPFMISNKKVVMSEKELEKVESILDTTTAGTLHKKLKKWHKKNTDGVRKRRTSGFLSFCQKMHASAAEQYPDNEMSNNGRTKAAEAMCSAWRQLDEKKKRKLSKHHAHCPDPVAAVLRPARYFGSLPEKMHETLDDYIKKNPDKLLEDEEDDAVSPGHISVEKFKSLLFLRTMNCLADPGEAVGLLAAQSIGEPSTQMTLNTFHFAGRGEMNVTLGIPRLREILMVASANIKTPNMDIPIRNTEYARNKAKPLQLKLNKVTLAQVLEDVKVCEYLAVKDKINKSRMYRLTFKFLPHEAYINDYCVTPCKVLAYVEKKFIRNLCDAVKKRILELSKAKLVNTATVVQSRRPQSEEIPAQTTANDEENDVASDDDMNDGDAAAMKARESKMQERDYQGEEEEKEEVGEEEEESEEELENEDVTLNDGVMGQSENSESTPVASQSGHDAANAGKKKSKKKKKNVEMDEIRVNAVLCCHQWVDSYTYDADNEENCEVTIRLALSDTRFDMASLIESEAKRAVVHQVHGITRAILGEVKTPGKEGTHLRTEGVNIVEMYQYDRILDLDRLYTNDIHAIAATYGIEAAARAILKECRDVFAAYGIEVDYRHLSLIADYMTFEGSYKPFNRMGIESNASPLQKMSFETTMHFLKQATISGSKDDLKSPSARLVVGRVVGVGTGSFGLRQPLVL